MNPLLLLITPLHSVGAGEGMDVGNGVGCEKVVTVYFTTTSDDDDAADEDSPASFLLRKGQ